MVPIFKQLHIKCCNRNPIKGPSASMQWRLFYTENLSMLLQGRNFTAEFKLLCFFFYFSIATVCGLALIGVSAGRSYQDQQLYSDYFLCETFGIDSDNPCVLEVNGYRVQSFIVAINAMFTLTPYVILIYILPVEKLVKRVKTVLEKSIDQPSKGINQRVQLK